MAARVHNDFDVLFLLAFSVTLCTLVITPVDGREKRQEDEKQKEKGEKK